MKNLKRTLALVLAVVLCFGLMTIGAGAAFTDDEDITYDAAVKLASDLDIIAGFEDGSFKPQQTLTRAQLASMIAYLGTGGNFVASRYAGLGLFSDVAATSWYAGAANYCASKGFLVGNGDGTYAPNSALTGYMVFVATLKVLGYDAAAENMGGATWKSTALTLAEDAGLLAGLNSAFDPAIAINREEAAQILYNALLAPTVKYTGGSTITVGGVSIVSGAVRSDVTYDHDANTTTAEIAKTAVIKYYGATVDATTVDAFSRPTTTYKIGAMILSAIPKTATLTYTTPVSAGALYTALGNDALATGDITYFVDGKSTTVPYAIAQGATTNFYGANGALTQVYYNAITSTAVISVVNTYLGTVGAVNAAAGTVTVTPNAVVPGAWTATGKTLTATGYAVGDYVLYTAAYDGSSAYVMKSVAAAESKTVTVSLLTGGSAPSFTADGAVYAYSAKVDTTAGLGANKIWLDSYGYVLDTDGTAAGLTNYAYLIEDDAGSFGVAQAQILKMDGTVATVNMVDAEDSLDYNLVSYTINTAGAYDFTSVAASVTTGAATTITQGVAAIKFNSATVNYAANAATVFLVKTGTTYASYTGIANVPNISLASGGTAAIYAVSGVAKIVYIENPTVGTTTNTVFIGNKDAYTPYTDATGTYRIYNAIVNGVATTVTTANSDHAGLYHSMSTNAAGISTLGSAQTMYTGTIAPAGGIIGLDSQGTLLYYAYSADVQVWSASQTAPYTMTEVGIATVLTDSSDKVYYTLNATSTAVTDIYILPVTTVDVTSAVFTAAGAETTVTITLTGGTFKAGTITKDDFTFAGTNAAAIAAGTFVRTSDTVVTVTTAALAAGADNAVTVKAATQATPATSVAGVAS